MTKRQQDMYNEVAEGLAQALPFNKEISWLSGYLYFAMNHFDGTSLEYLKTFTPVFIDKLYRLTSKEDIHI